MNCEDWRCLVEEYFDGELDTNTALEVRHHLDRCASCSAGLKGLNAEQSVYANYQSEVEISPELWAGVRQRLEAEKPVIQRYGSWLQNIFVLPPVSAPVAVGLVVLAVVLTVVVMSYISAPSGVAPDRIVAEGTPQQALPAPQNEMTEVARSKNEDTSSKAKGIKHNVVTTATSYGKSSTAITNDIHKTKDPRRLVLEAEQKYLAAIAMLSRSVDRKKSRLDPAIMAELEQALSSIDRTIAATRKVVRRHPDDPVAAQYMLTAYAKKVDVLRELVDY
ncbi:MAG TPA: anti-sigma factor [Pyrinomonadaceae bacterium]|nr:anti-sigma factor [Pyrinomonadaceae bacterium]